MIYKDDLERVYALIEDPKRWTTGVFARNADGEETAPLDESASCWCLYGAAGKSGLRSSQFFAAVKKDNMDYRSDLSEFNDNRDHAEVLDLLRKAIERAPVRP